MREGQFQFPVLHFVLSTAQRRALVQNSGKWVSRYPEIIIIIIFLNQAISDLAGYHLFPSHHSSILFAYHPRTLEIAFFPLLCAAQLETLL